MNEIIACLIGATVTLFGIYIAQSNGLLLYWVAKDEHDLNVRKAKPMIDATVRIDQRQVNPPGYRPFHYIITSIHNHGDLAAQQLKGNWRMHCPNNSIRQYDIPIRRDALGSTPYQFDACQIIGPNIDSRLVEGDQSVTLYVDIEFDYLGISPDQPEHYSARWQYDYKNRQMVRV
jgi:hypothetical protein